MSVKVTVALGDDGLVAVKSASTPDDAERIRAEAARLRRAGHPGVVTLLSSGPASDGPGDELRTGYAGDTLDGWRGTLAQAAGLAAAVAATIADLHEIGLVHGRLDVTHVLLGADGRPRLCGLSGPGGAGPADDVEDLGLLVEALLDRVVPERRVPWRRAVPADHRALAQVAGRALDPTSGRRPSARSLAGSILAVVPTAELPPPASSDTPPTPAEPAPPAAPKAGGRAVATGSLPWTVTDPSPARAHTARDHAAHRVSPGHAPLTSAHRSGPTPHGPSAGGGVPALPAPGMVEASRVAIDAAPGGLIATPSLADVWHTITVPAGPAPHSGDGLGTPPAALDRGGGHDHGAAADDPDGTPSTHAPGWANSSGGAPRRDDLADRDHDGHHPTNHVPPEGPGTNPAFDAASVGPEAGDDVGHDVDDLHDRDDIAGEQHGQDVWPEVGVADPPRYGDSLALGHPERDAVGDDGWLVEPEHEDEAMAKVRMWIARGPDESFWDDADTGDAVSGDEDDPRGGASAEPDVVPPARPTPRPSLRVGSASGRARRAGIPDLRRSSSADRRDRGHEGNGHRRRTTVGIAAGAVGVTLAAGVLAAGGASPANGPGSAADRAGGDEATGHVGCVAVPAPAADVDGDGCPEALAVEGHAVSAGDARWTLGEPGDLVAIGDWDCDGVASPALLRPATGDVFVFPIWAPEGAPATVAAVRSVAGAAALRAEPAPDGCDALVVDVTGGEPVVVGEARA